MRFINAVLDALAACALIVFAAGAGLVQWDLDAARARREQRERRRQTRK